MWWSLLPRTGHITGLLASRKPSLLRLVKKLDFSTVKKLITDRCGCGAVHPLSLHPLLWKADLEQERLARWPPVRTLLSGNPHQAVHHAFVLRLGTDLLGWRLHLQQQLHPLNGGHRGLGHSRCDPACQQVLPEGWGVKEPLFRLLLLLLLRRFTLHRRTMEVKTGSSLANTPEKDDEGKWKTASASSWRESGAQDAGISACRARVPRSCAGASNRLPPSGTSHVTPDTWLLHAECCLDKSRCNFSLLPAGSAAVGNWIAEVQEGSREG